MLARWDRRYYSTNTGDRSNFTIAIPVFSSYATLHSSGLAVSLFSLSVIRIKNTSLYAPAMARP